MNNKTKIILADDHEIMVEGLRVLLEKQEGFEVIGIANDGLEALQMIQQANPDIAILDISMPNLNGLDASARIHKEFPDVKVIILSMHKDDGFITKAFGGGAKGYVLKNSAYQELVQAIQTVLKNEVYVSPKLMSTVMMQFISKSDPTKQKSQPELTLREREVLQIIAEGKTAKEIASMLNISVKTAEIHRRNIMNKLNAKSTAELTKYAIKEGLTGLDS